MKRITANNLSKREPLTDEQPKDAPPPVLYNYFAYGSNMWVPRIEERLGKVVFSGVTRLWGFKLTFNAGIERQYGPYVNVEKTGKMDDSVEGVVYRLTRDQLRLLDQYEGLYNRVIERMQGRDLHIYMAICDRHRTATGAMMPSYITLLKRGCLQHQFNDTLAKILEFEADNEIKRKAELALYEQWLLLKRKKKSRKK